MQDNFVLSEEMYVTISLQAFSFREERENKHKNLHFVTRAVMFIRVVPITVSRDVRPVWLLLQPLQILWSPGTAQRVFRSFSTGTGRQGDHIRRRWALARATWSPSGMTLCQTSMSPLWEPVTGWITNTILPLTFSS